MDTHKQIISPQRENQCSKTTNSHWQEEPNQINQIAELK